MALATPPAAAGPLGIGARIGDLGRLTTPLRVGLWLTGFWTGAGVMLWLAFPQLAPALLLLSALPPLIWCWAVERPIPLFRPTPSLAVLMLATGYLALNAVLWSPSRATALPTILYITLMLGTLHVVPHLLPRLDRRVLLALAGGCIGGLIAGSIFVALEALSGQAVQHGLVKALTAVSPGALAMLGQESATVDPFSINKNLAVLALLLGPAAFMAGRLRLGRRQRLALLAALALAVLTILASTNATSKLAIIAGIATLGLSRLRPVLASRLVLACWVALNLCVVPMAHLLYRADLHHTTWLPESWRHRVVIWQQTAERVPDAPILGSGMDAARIASAQARAHPTPVPGTPFTQSTDLHAHNIYLQLWYDAGATGVLLCVVLGVLAVRGVTQAPGRAQPLLLAQFTATVTMGAFSYSLWAPWFMASLAMSSMTALLATVAVAAAPRPEAGVSWRAAAAAVLAATRAGATWAWSVTLRIGRVLISAATAVTSRMAAAAAAVARFRRSRAALAVSTAMGIGAAACAQLLVVAQPVVLDPGAIKAEQGFAYTVEITPPTVLLRLAPGDDGQPAGDGRPTLRLTENDTRLGPSDVLHQDIRDKGAGRYDLAGTRLYLSASDNTDPRANGRRYVAVVRMAVSPVATWPAGLLAALILLAGWPAIARRVSAAAAAIARFRPSRTALVVSAAAGLMAALGLQTVVLHQPITLAPEAIAPEQGFAYTVEITPPTVLLRLSDRAVREPEAADGSLLMEDATSIGPADALHRDIREKGAGRYDLHRTHLYFSATDNSDPRHNGRRYIAIVPMGLSPIAAWIAGLLAAVILLVASQLRPHRKRTNRPRQ